MDKLISNFTGFDGRLNRQAWWISVVILIVAALVLNFILGMIMGTGMVDIAQAMDPGYFQKLAWQGVIVSIITAYPYIAISVKRRHDRGNNGYDAIGLIVFGILYNILQAIGVISPLNMTGTIVGLLFAVYALYVVIQLGFLKGTVGPNEYGPDPLQG